MDRRILFKFSLLLLVFLIAFGCSKQLTDKELVELAQIEGSKGNTEKAVNLYEELLRVHPDSEHAAMSLFMIGYLNANQLGNSIKAKRVYNEFLEKYPDSELVASVKFELENMGKRPEEILK